MRPLKLTITAFGPYANLQVIDFRELNGRNLFVITGDTGAGKTTILDGISYALYGKASGRDRDGESLRSHFAVADLLTSVELEFELRGQRYWVRRIPKQRKKRTRGEGYTDQNPEAEFKNLDGEIKVVTGVKEVSEKIVQLMGLSYEQFKQIIMIPQGEFRELLNAESKVRQEILQKIFGTEGFRRVQDLFDGQAKALSQDVNRLVSQRNEWIRSLDGSGYAPLLAVLEMTDFNVPLVMDEVERAIELDDMNGKNLQSKIDEYEGQVTIKQEEIFQGKGTNLKFTIRDKAKLKKIELEAQRDEFEEKKSQLQQARKALGLTGVDDYRNSRADYVAKKEKELIQSKEKEEKTKVDAKMAQHNYELEKSKEEERNEQFAEQTRLEALMNKITDWEVGQNRVVKLEQELAAAQREREEGKKQVEIARNEVQEYQISLNKGKEITVEYERKVSEYEKITGIYDKLNTLQEECNHLVILKESISILKEQVTEHFIKYEKTQTDYEEAQHLFFEGQAGVLASQLKVGEACPVCGSDHHPKLAILSTNSPTESQLKRLLNNYKQGREIYDEVKGRYERSKADEHAQSQILSRLQKELDENVSESIAEFNVTELIEYVSEQLPNYQFDREQLQVEITKIASQKNNAEGIERRLKEKTETITSLTVALEELDRQYIELFAQLQSAKDALKKIAAELPYDVRSVADLTMKLESVQKKYRLMKQALAKAEEKNRDQQMNYATAVTERSGIEKVLHEGQADLLLAEQNFMTALLTAGFNDEFEYGRAKLRENEIVSLEKEINTYQEELRSATDSYFQIEQEVETLTPVDVIALEGKLLKLQIEKKELIAERTTLMTRQIHNQKILKKIDTLIGELECQEEEYLLIGHLARIAKGDNEQKISFERYVLAAFFNDIIEAANGRLKKMTGGRYEMSRISQKGKGGGQSGLEIEVFDYYTGQSRHVKTLSGGESFKASLALALGLAEVVQSYAGGISLETMFVDEGFGTLDPESLDTAISCLIELQHSGRLVGIISHVPELKGSIDARLEIEAYKDGSRAQFSIM
ncbi:AAA family ATPase [Pelosinus sp. sgz500959]|uniref:AAA family ATPase n=1 Tax=Pelosinus sp. sgz500959 TaxID=3242472 RepID=UPI0036709F40